MKFIFPIVLILTTAPTIVVSQTERTNATAVEEVLRTEREQRDAFLKRDIAKTERLVADEFVLTSRRDIGDKTTLLGFLKSSPVDPTLTLTTEDTHVKIDGDTAIVFGRRVETRRREDNNREGTAYARYVRTYIKRQGQGRPPGELLPESEAEFFLKDRDVQVIFMRNRKGEVTHAIMRINGADIRATRRK